MKVLLLGNGVHAKKRILPALNKINSVERIVIGDRSVTEKEDLSNKIRVLNYDTSISNPDSFDLCIIATPPYNHADSLKKIYNKTDKILIEKPISSDINWIFSQEFKKLYTNKNLFEAIMFFHHPAWDEVRKIINEYEIIKIISEFSVPHLEKESYRYKKIFGGGSLNDQGIYPISLASELIKNSYNLKKIKIFSDKSFEVDLSGEFEMLIDNKIDFIGKWGLGKEYKNYIKLFDKSGTELSINFFYSKPDNEKLQIKYKNISGKNNKTINATDQFENMYLDLINNSFSRFSYSEYKNLIKRYEIYQKILEHVI